MKGLFYVVFLLLSLPNLIAGLAALLLQHTFRSRDLLQIMTDFLFGVVWGFPLAALIFVVLLVAGLFSATRSYAAIVAFVLNMAALNLVLIRLFVPTDFDEGVVFLPVIVALVGFAWIAYRGFVTGQSTTKQSHIAPLP